MESSDRSRENSPSSTESYTLDVQKINNKIRIIRTPKIRNRQETSSNSNTYHSFQEKRFELEESITFKFLNELSTNSILTKLSKSAKNLIRELLEDIETKFLRRIKGIPINYSHPSKETVSLSTNTEPVEKNQPNNNEDLKVILNRLNDIEKNLETNNKIVQDIQTRTLSATESLQTNSNLKSFASIVANTTHKNSIILRPKTAKEAPKIIHRLQKLNCPNNIKILKVRTDKEKIDIRTNNETEKNNLKEFLSKQAISTDIVIEDKTPAKRRVIFYNITENLTEEKIKDMINEHLGFTIDNKEINLQMKIPGKYEREHWIFQMPRSYALELTKEKYLQNGFQKIFFKKYIHIPRCTRCNILNKHTTKQCTYKNYCSNCTEEHHFTECKSKNFECINCKEYNNSCLKKASCNTDPILKTLRNTNHSAASNLCPTYFSLYEEIIKNKY
jgi:hypothetical protein